MKWFWKRNQLARPRAASISAYEEAASNPELLAAEKEVNAEPFETQLINPIEEERLDPY